MKNRIGRIIALTLTGLLCLTGAAFAEEGAPDEANTLENMLTYRECLNPEIQYEADFKESDLIFEIPAENAAYREQLAPYIRTENHVQTVNGLRFTALRSMTVNNLYALEWTLENVSDEPRLIAAGMFMANGESGSGNVADESNRVLLPGEKVQCVAATMFPGLKGESCELSMAYGEYRIAESALPEDRSEPLYPEEDQVELVCVDEFSLSVPRAESPVMSALKDGAFVEVEWRGSTLRVTEAWQSLSNGSYTVMRIFDTKEEALANNPCSDDWWDVQPYSELDEDGDKWVMVGGGTIDDEPFELEDGRWAYSLTRTAELMNWMPGDTIYMVPSTPDKEVDGARECDWASAIELKMQYEHHAKAS